jgi:signal transduction histidine kinase
MYEYFGNLVSQLPTIFYVLDQDWKFLISEGKGLEMIGLHPGQAVGVSAKDMYHDYPDILEAVQSAFCGKHVMYHHTIGDTHLENYVAPYYNNEGEIIGVVGSTVDISTRVEAEATLMELNRTLEQKVEERTQELKSVNEDLSAANEELTALNEEVVAMNEELATTNEQLIDMQKSLVESEKMAALGGLVAGVAHEVNTPIGIGLTASSHLSDIAKELLTLNQTKPLTTEDIIPFLEDIDKASQIIYKNLNRAAHLITSFKQLSVDQTAEPKREFDLGAYIDEVLISLSPSLKKTEVKIMTDCPEVIMINGYPGSIAQVITNLVMNSLKHAYLPGDAGHIHITTTRNKSMIQIVYSDDGCGMDEYTLSRIYEPFFTTNRAGGGSGLGLSIVYSIITQQYGGSIRCTSTPKEGATFLIRIKGDVK